jgi:hypothetical protein
MKNDVQINFVLWGTTISPKEISERTGIEADVALLKGEGNKKLMTPRENYWSLRSHVQSDYVEDHWRDLEHALEKKKIILKEIAKTGLVKITLIVNSDSRIPPITIPPEMSAFAAFFNASIDIDHL